MSLKSFLKRVYYWGVSSEKEFQHFQKDIRDAEWQEIVDYIPPGSRFLDVGCGTGYSMLRAIKDRGCICFGVDPFPNNAGVSHQMEEVSMDSYKVVQGFAESLPVVDDSVDVVYSSHVLEHVKDEGKSLQEMSRVLKTDGMLIIGMPTASMSMIRLFSILLFETHRNLIAILSWPFRPEVRIGRRFIDLIIPPSHGQPGQTIFSDLFHYKVSNWANIVGTYFLVEKTIYPAFYSFPDYKQLFKMRKLSSRSSSVFFICRKRTNQPINNGGSSR